MEEEKKERGQRGKGREGKGGSRREVGKKENCRGGEGKGLVSRAKSACFWKGTTQFAGTSPQSNRRPAQNAAGQIFELEPRRRHNVTHTQ